MNQEKYPSGIKRKVQALHTHYHTVRQVYRFKLHLNRPITALLFILFIHFFRSKALNISVIFPKTKLQRFLKCKNISKIFKLGYYKIFKTFIYLRSFRGAIKKLPNFGHCLNMGGGSAAQPNFLSKKSMDMF